MPQKIIFLIIEINVFWGDLSGISAKTATLIIIHLPGAHLLRIVWLVTIIHRVRVNSTRTIGLDARARKTYPECSYQLFLFVHQCVDLFLVVSTWNLDEKCVSKGRVYFMPTAMTVPLCSVDLQNHDSASPWHGVIVGATGVNQTVGPKHQTWHCHIP